MSILLEQSSLINTDIRRIKTDLEVVFVDRKGYAPDRDITLYSIKDTQVALPFSYAVNILKKKRRPRSDFRTTSVEFTGSLREDQEEVKKEALDSLNKTGSTLLSLHVGWGKTYFAIKLATCIKLPTLIICNRIQLLKQWKSEIENLCSNAKVQILDSKSKLNSDCDFYIMNALNIPKMPVGYFDSIGLSIVDESHLIVAESLSRCLQCISPRYLIGLTATPYRPDGFDILLELYFGKNRIIRKLKCPHIVYKVFTGVAPIMKTTDAGKLNWNLVLKSLSENKERNQIIVDIVRKFNNRIFLILTKRVNQGRKLAELLIEAGESVTTLLETEQSFDKDARILIGTTSKCGTGFNHPRLNTLLLASDMDEYFIQALGRIFRKRDGDKPVVFDLIDKNRVLYKHFESREEVYTEVGAEFLTYE